MTAALALASTSGASELSPDLETRLPGIPRVLQQHEVEAGKDLGGDAVFAPLDLDVDANLVIALEGLAELPLPGQLPHPSLERLPSVLGCLESTPRLLGGEVVAPVGLLLAGVVRIELHHRLPCRHDGPVAGEEDHRVAASTEAALDAVALDGIQIDLGRLVTVDRGVRPA